MRYLCLVYLDEQRLDEAIRLAAGIPPARVGSIEVRPIRETVARAEALRHAKLEDC